MDIYKTNVLKDELLRCDDIEELKFEILPKIQQQRDAWQQKIEEIMTKNRYAVKDMAELCGVSVTSVRKWCKGSLPQSREMYIRIGFAAKYNLEEMNSFLQRYGRYPRLYAKSLEDSICMFVLGSDALPHDYDTYQTLLGQMQEKISGYDGAQEANYSTTKMQEWVLDIKTELEMEKFIIAHVGEFQNAYHRLYNAIQAFLQLNLTSSVDQTKISIQDLAESQNWSSSLRHCISEIRSKRWFPMRRKLISLGLHLNMDLEELNEMLELAQMEVLCAKNPVEAVLIFALEDARLNDAIVCDGTDVLCNYVREIFEQLQIEDAEYILDDL